MTHPPTLLSGEKEKMKRRLALALSVLITTSVFAQTDSQNSKPKSGRKSNSTAPVSKRLEDMQDAISAQQQQIQQLQQQVQNRDQAIQTLQQQVIQAQAAAQEAQQTANAANKGEIPENAEIGTLQHDVADLKMVSGNTVNELQETQKRVAGLESPLAIHYKGVTLTPGGFLAAETVWRQRAAISDINTPFNSIPFSAAGQARQGEFYGSGRQSRASMLAQGKLASVNATGYYEADFLSAGVTSNNNQSNSYTFRQRQMWGQAGFSDGWTFTGGQMWSLVTETKVGLDNRTEATPLTIDAQYQVGFSWARQYGFRVTKNFQNKAWIGFSVENALTLITVSGAPSVTCGTTTCGNFLLGGPGTGGGLYNLNANYSSNVSPDLIVKAAFQPGWGHYEIYAVGSLFRERIYPNALNTPPSAAGAYNNNTLGGGFGANARWLMAQKKVEFGLHYLGGNGVGRYGTSTLPDVTVYGNGSEHLVRSYQGLASLEYHVPKWDFYFYGGGEYAGRQSSFFKGKPAGYGSPFFVNTGCGTEVLPGTGGFLPGGLSSCAGNTRAVIEGTSGFWYKPYNGPKGRFQIGLQYSYVTRDAWSGIGGQPEAIDNMFLTSFRYYLP
jgi:TolA-binding protein